MAVVPNEDDRGWDYECRTVVDGVPCEFVSREWPTKAGATGRGQEHREEHLSGEPAPELAESKVSLQREPIHRETTFEEDEPEEEEI